MLGGALERWQDLLPLLQVGMIGLALMQCIHQIWLLINNRNDSLLVGTQHTFLRVSHMSAVAVNQVSTMQCTAAQICNETE